MATDIRPPPGVVIGQGGWAASTARAAARISAPARPGNKVMPGPSGIADGEGSGNRVKRLSSVGAAETNPPAHPREPLPEPPRQECSRKSGALHLLRCY